MPDWLLPVLASPFIGSFLGVLIQRLPEGDDLVASRSRCNSCQRNLGAADLIPIVSYLAARGRCRHCGAPIGRFHLLIELGALLVAVWAATVDDGLRLWADCVLGWTLLALAWIDARHMILPDVLTLPLVLAGLVFAWFLDPPFIADHAIGAMAGWLLFWTISHVYRRLRGRDGLGEGDAKLMAAAGAWLSWMGLGPVMLVGAVTGLAVALTMRLRGRDISGATAIPFGPPLAFAIWVVWIYAPSMLGM
ncbi:MAG TPA: A24 family peptidase [Alphaproteobacteria bacterium]|nr:A24 family peptidase [Alphaproteobacteria bacterium]